MKVTLYILIALSLPLASATGQSVAAPIAVTVAVWPDRAVFRLVAPPGAYRPIRTEAAAAMDWRRFEWLFGWEDFELQTASGFRTGVSFWLPERTGVGATDDLDAHVLSIHPLGSIEAVHIGEAPPLAAGWRRDTLWIRPGRSSPVNELLAQRPDSIRIGPTAFGRWLAAQSAAVTYYLR